MKKVKLVLSVFLATVIVMSSVISAFAVSVSSHDDKISEQLKVAVSENKSDSIPVYIFLNESDKSIVFENLEKKYDYNTLAYENKNVYYEEILPNLIVEDKKVSQFVKEDKITSEMLSLSNDNSCLSVETRKKINQEMVKDFNTYLKHYRKEISSIIIDYVSEFVDKNKDMFEEILSQPKYGEFIIARVLPENIHKLTRQTIVNSIDICSLDEDINHSWSATSLIETDCETGLGSNYYNDGSGYDGTGITIGIIEAESGRYDEDDFNLSDANITFVPTDGVSQVVESEHATRVSSLICGKNIVIDDKIYGGAATGATVYQTAVMGSPTVSNALSMFADMGVNVVNYSGGGYTGPGYSSYDRSVDDILSNSRLLLVSAAGNAGDSIKQVASPAKAFNGIAVGNLETKIQDENLALDSPFRIKSSSSYFESSHIANKPDVVAPGSYLCFPISDTQVVDRDAEGYYFSGTSFSAPLVTALAAQIMQSDCFAIYNSNAAKNYIICGASNNDITDTTVSYGALMDKSGAGLVNAVNSFECSNFGTEFYGAFNAYQNTPTDYMTVATYDLFKGDCLRVALTFKKEEDILLDSEYANNIDIRLVRNNPYSSYCVKSESLNNNVELIDTKVQTTGTYWLQIRFTNSILESGSNSDLHYWISWRTY